MKQCGGPSGSQTPTNNGRHQEACESYMDRQTLSIMKACEAVGVSRRTIYNWISAGKVEYVRTAGGSIRIFADTLWRDAAAPARPEEADSRAASGPHA